MQEKRQVSSAYGSRGPNGEQKFWNSLIDSRHHHGATVQKVEEKDVWQPIIVKKMKILEKQKWFFSERLS